MASKDDTEQFQTRAYQLEMLEESLKRNIIVAMDTGSGKTHVAILRIGAELQKAGSAGKLAWMLCPSVALARQQAGVVARELPALASRAIVGDDGVDHWGGAGVWEAALRGLRVVVSTYVVLLDALRHGFLRLDRLALLVADEAHHCVGKNPLNSIMQQFYHPAREIGAYVPAVLGLTASPVVRSNIRELEMIERNLDAVCRSPRVSREEFLRHVRRPELVLVPYCMSQAEEDGDYWFVTLSSAYENLDMRKDPWIKRMMAERKDDNAVEFDKAFFRRKTYCCEQLRSIISNVDELSRELGPWASRRYMALCYNEVKMKLLVPGNDPFRIEELKFIENFLHGSNVPCDEGGFPPAEDEISPKVLRLLSLLRQEVRGKSAGIVFAKTRATVGFLARLLSNASTKNLVRVGTFVGLSNSKAKSSNICENIGKFNQMNSLDDLRTGHKNLVVCTNACEEGIDISACNFVICYDNPPNLKSFIQRRGRARAKDSRYIIMHQQGSGQLKRDWDALEETMKNAYMDDQRKRQEIEKLEVSEYFHRELTVQETGARITLEEAVAHLDHFCNKLPAAKFASVHPVYLFQENDKGRLTCKVELPVSMDASLRSFEGPGAWKTERLAKKNAAFEAYLGLYNAGLLDEHLLPHPAVPDNAIAEAIKENSEWQEHLVDIPAQKSFFAPLAQAWKDAVAVYRYTVHVQDAPAGLIHGSEEAGDSMTFCLPFKIEIDTPMKIHWDEKITLTVYFEFHSMLRLDESLDPLNCATDVLLRSVFASRMEQERNCQYPMLFAPLLGMANLQAWVAEVGALKHADAMPFDWPLENKHELFLIKRKGQSALPYQYLGKEDHEVDGVWPDYKKVEMRPCFKMKKFPARTDFLHPVPTGQESVQPVKYMAVCNALIQEMPGQTARFAMLIPSIMHHVGRRIHADHFRKTFLNELSCPLATEVILEALSTSSAREPVNYQRLEFLGDALLGFYVAVHVMDLFPHHHEGQLTVAKSWLVSNSVLSKRALDSGIAEYIIMEAFTGTKWSPPSNEILLKTGEDEPQRKISTKTLADIIEALIGAAFMQAEPSGLKESWDAVMVVLKFSDPVSRWMPLEHRVNSLLSRVDQSIPMPPDFEVLESLIGYSFRRPAILVEAMTHPSESSNTSVSSYNRLEFLGDSVLEMLVTKIIFRSGFVPADMSLLRTAVVNNHFLAFLSFKMTIAVACTDVVGPLGSGAKAQDQKYSIVATEKHVRLHEFMLHAPSYQLAEARSQTTERFDKYRDQIDTALEHEDRYPWTLLSNFGPEKFFGDLVESVLGAIYTDSGGEEACYRFLERLGVLRFLDRAIKERVTILQPKQELGIVADQEKVQYEVSQEDGKFTCHVSVGERNVATAVGRNRADAETIAASDALRILKQEKESAENGSLMDTS